MIESKLIENLEIKSRNYFIQLLKQIKAKKTTIYVGAGLSASCGVPTWNKLTEEICTTFFAHWEFAKDTKRVPTNMSIAFWEKFLWSEQDKILAKKFSANDPMKIMEQIKSQIEPRNWIYLIRKILYYQNEIEYSSLLEAVVNLISTDEVNNVLTTNYDDLIENRMKEKGLIVNSFSFEPINNDSINQIIHLHGILPIYGGKKTRIIFTESEYNEEFSKPYSWTNIVQLTKFCNETCLFIGTSFTDVNLIKLLRTSRGLTRNMHYALIFDNLKEEPKIKKLFDNYLYNLGVKVIRLPMKDEADYSSLLKYIDIINDFIKNEKHELRKYTT